MDVNRINKPMYPEKANTLIIIIKIISKFRILKFINLKKLKSLLYKTIKNKPPKNVDKQKIESINIKFS